MRHYKTLAFYKSSKRDTCYTVKIDQDGNLSCNCPKWLYPKKGQPRFCRHTILAREEFGDTISDVKEYGLWEVESLSLD